MFKKTLSTYLGCISPAAFVGGASIVLVIAGAVALSGTLPGTQQNVEASARAVVAACADADYHPACYEEKIPALIDQGTSMEDAFEITRQVQQMDRTFAYCHVLGHKLSAKETAKDPSKWKDVAARSPLGLCSYGGIHGAFQERFRSEWLEPDQYGSFVEEVAGVCSEREGWRPSGLEQASCTHAMGHLTMFVTNGSVNNALGLCRSVIDASIMQQGSLPLCYDGVFMQVFQPLEPEDIALVEEIRPKTEDEAKHFCATYTGAALSSCTSERWPYSAKALEKDARALATYCAEAGEDEKFCFVKMTNLMTARMQFSPQKMAEYCAPLTGWQQESCIVNSTSRMLENDLAHAGDAVTMCEGASTAAIKDACFAQLSYMIPFSIPKREPQFSALCNRLPSPYTEACINAGK